VNEDSRSANTRSCLAIWQEWRATLLVGLLALAVRAVYLHEISRAPIWGMIIGDAKVYDAWARNIAAGDWIGKGVFYQAPLYPYVLGAVYRLFGASHVVGTIFQALLEACSCVLLARAGRRFFNPAVGTLAGLFLALSPAAVFHVGILQKSTLELFLFTLLLLALARTGREAGPRRWIEVGLALGLLALSRENVLVLFALLPLWAVQVAGPASRRRGLIQASLVFAGALAVLLPVAFRNLAVGGEFFITTAQLGPNLYIGNNPNADGNYIALRPGRGDAAVERQDAVDLAEQALGRKLTAHEVSGYWIGEALRFVTRRPGDWLRLEARKAALALNYLEILDGDDQYSYAESSVVLRALTFLLNFGVLLPLAVAGIWLTRGDWRRRWIVYAVPLFYLATLLIFYVNTRYRLLLVPCLAFFAAAGVIEAARCAHRRYWGECAKAAAAALSAAVIAFLPVAQSDLAKNRGVSQFNYGTWVWVQRHDADLALAAFARAASLSPQAVEPLRQSGVVLEEAGRPQEGLEFLRRALERDPASADLRYHVGNCLLALGKAAAAADAYREVLRLNPSHAEALYQLSLALQKTGR
jgi:tetratricopeptide (TPR) repeat protein